MSAPDYSAVRAFVAELGACHAAYHKRTQRMDNRFRRAAEDAGLRRYDSALAEAEHRPPFTKIRDDHADLTDRAIAAAAALRVALGLPPREETPTMQQTNASSLPPETVRALACADCGCTARAHVEVGPKMAPPIHGNGTVYVEMTLAISGRDVPCKTPGCPCQRFRALAVGEVAA